MGGTKVFNIQKPKERNLEGEYALGLKCLSMGSATREKKNRMVLPIGAESDNGRHGDGRAELPQCGPAKTCLGAKCSPSRSHSADGEVLWANGRCWRVEATRATICCGGAGAGC